MYIQKKKKKIQLYFSCCLVFSNFSVWKWCEHSLGKIRYVQNMKYGPGILSETAALHCGQWEDWRGSHGKQTAKMKVAVSPHMCVLLYRGWNTPTQWSHLIPHSPPFTCQFNNGKFLNIHNRLLKHHTKRLYIFKSSP